jgi:hypothetical protein
VCFLGSVSGTAAVTSMAPLCFHNREIPLAGSLRTLTTTASGPSSAWICARAAFAFSATMAMYFMVQKQKAENKKQ